jgi:cell division protein FtsB
MKSGGPAVWSSRPLGGRLVVLVVIAMAGLLGLRFMVADDGYPAVLSLRSDMALVHDELRQLNAENDQLEQRISALRGNSYPVEKLAREELDFALPGEIIYLFPEDLRGTGLTAVHGEPGTEAQP